MTLYVKRDKAFKEAAKYHGWLILWICEVCDRKNSMHFDSCPMCKTPKKIKNNP